MPPKVMLCGPKCRSREHAYELNVAISKGNLHEVQSFCAQCYNGAQFNDLHGRSALHIAASCGKLEVIEWLLEEKNSDVTLKDVESGWTALHRAIFYGQIAAARLLIQHKSDLYTRDHEGLGPLDIAMHDRKLIRAVPPPVYQLQDRHEVYTWGDNSNFTLGHVTEHRRSNPEVVDELRKQNITIKQVVMCNYHTVFVTDQGKVYTCGHGLGGRLGHPSQETCLVPCLVEALSPEVVESVAAARDHTVFLTQSGAVYSCGLNEHHQLGQLPVPEHSALPRPMSCKPVKGRCVKGVAAGRFHTVLYTADSVFTCGLNAGQMGHLKPKDDRKVTQLRQVSALNVKEVSIKLVQCSDAATVVLTESGEIYVLHEYQCRIIASNRSDIQRLCVVGGCLDHADSQILRENGGKELIISYLNSTGKVFVWRDRSTSFKRSHWLIRRSLYVTDFILTESGMAVVTEMGKVFVCHLSSKPPPVREAGHASKESVSGVFGQMSLMDLLMQEETEEVQVHSVPGLHRATYITADRKGHNYAAVQSLPNCNLTDVPTVSKASMRHDFGKLLEEADEYDLIHDLIIQIHDQIWPVHSFILVNRCANFISLLNKGAEKKNEMNVPVINIEDIHPQILDQLLLYVYTDTCDLLKPGSKFDLAEHHVPHGNDGVFHMEVDEPMEIADNKKVSAFQVHKQRKHKHHKEETDSQNNNNNNQRNPVKLLQDLARKWGVKGLAKKLDCVKYHKGLVQSFNKQMPRSTLQFYRDKHRDSKWELCDVSLQSDDGQVFPCHRCVLVARLEYFHSMLATGWMETSSSSALLLPIPADIMEILLDYLYTDESLVVQNSQNVELLCNVLVVADQMLVTRLKQMCEAAVAALLTLRNVAEVLEFASTYNADQLRTTCQQYIAINLPALLEARCLEVLSDSVMEDLIKYYRNSIDNMSRRIITPYDEFPDKAYLESLAAEDIDLTSPLGFKPEPKKPKSKKKRHRTKSSTEEQEREKGSVMGPEGPRTTERQLSVSSDISIKSDEENMEPMISISVGIGMGKSGFPNTKSPTGPWCKLTSAVSPPAPNSEPSSNPIPTVTAGSQPTGTGLSLRDIMAQESSQTRMPKNNSGQKTGKFSWKEEKKKQQQKGGLKKNHKQDLTGSVLADKNTNSQFEGKTGSQLKEKTPGSNPWGAFSTVVESFRSLMVEDEDAKAAPGPKGDKAGQVRQGKPHTSSKNSSNSTMSWGLPKSSITIPRLGKLPTQPGGDGPVSPRSPDNPWQSPGLAQSPKSPTTSFSQIVIDEQKKNEVLEKNINKPLSLIQIEEQAIQELLKHYNADANVDEQISVERVPQAAATPLWKRERLTST